MRFAPLTIALGLIIALIIGLGFLKRDQIKTAPVQETQIEGMLLTCYDADDNVTLQNFAFRKLIEVDGRSYAVGTDGYEQEITGSECEIDIE